MIIAHTQWHALRSQSFGFAPRSALTNPAAEMPRVLHGSHEVEQHDKLTVCNCAHGIWPEQSIYFAKVLFPFHLSRSVSNNVIQGLPVVLRVLTKQRRHYSTVLGPEQSVSQSHRLTVLLSQITMEVARLRAGVVERSEVPLMGASNRPELHCACPLQDEVKRTPDEPTRCRLHRSHVSCTSA